MPVAIKAGATISSDYFKGLRSFAARLPDPPKRSALVYGGTEPQERTGVSVWRACDVARMMRSFDS